MLTRLFWSMAWMFYIYYRSVSPALPETFCRLCVYKYSDCYIEKVGNKDSFMQTMNALLVFDVLSVNKIETINRISQCIIKILVYDENLNNNFDIFGNFSYFLNLGFFWYDWRITRPSFLVSTRLFTYSKLFYLTLFIFFIIVTEVLSWSW